MKSLPPLERVVELLNYNPSSGLLTWKVDRGGRKSSKAGDEAGCLAKSGYRMVSIDGSTYRAHRLVWLIQTKTDPGQMEVDHIDMDRSNNAWENLRLATHQQNKYNAQYRAKTKTGLKNISVSHNKSNPYMVHMRVEGVKKNIGYFSTIEEAVKARDAALELHHGRFCRK